MTFDLKSEAIEALRAQLGERVTIVGHHYQSDAVIRHTDIRGDSLELARRVASEVTSEHIVFCGVFFMAESAALLSSPNQHVHIPDRDAECTMALMSPGALARTVMRKLTAAGRKVVPLAYVNSTLELKAVVGAFGGAVCTSANAVKMMEWALDQGDSVLFLPDKNLGANVADRIGIPETERSVINIRGGGDQLDVAAANRKRLLLWPGHCPIHSRFKVSDVEARRHEFPGAQVIVHPESTPEVVASADADGSTSFIIQYVAEAPAGSTIVIGTEINLVNRLAAEHKNRVKIVPLTPSRCTYMARITESGLEATLRSLLKEPPYPYSVTVPDDLKRNARASLETMLHVCS